MTPLRQRMIDDMQLRNLAPETQRNYIAHCAAFAKFFGKSPELLDQEAVREYLRYQLNERRLQPESINQQVSALKFLYLTTLEMPWGDQDFPRRNAPPPLTGRAQPGGSMAVLRSRSRHSLPRGADDLLRGGSARFRGRGRQSVRYRLATHAAARRAR